MSTLTPDLKNAGWSLSEDGKAIQKTFLFKTFPDAMGWMVRAAFHAEAADHHPDWSNVYNRVDVRLTTHDSGGLTDKDIALAAAFEALS